MFVPRIKINKYVYFAQFRSEIPFVTLQKLYCIHLMWHNAAALRWQFEFDEVRQLLQTRNI